MSVTIQPGKLLSNALLLDAVTSGASGVLLVSTAGTLGPLLGLPVDLLRYAGLLFLPWAAMLAFTAMRQTLPKVLVWLVIGLNAVYALESVLAVALGWLQPTTLGYAFVLFQAAVVAALAEAQYIGLRRSMAADTTIAAQM